MTRSYISVDRRAFDGALQISIGEEDENGCGTGYRIAGPKYDGNGKSLLKHFLSDRDKQEIAAYLTRRSMPLQDGAVIAEPNKRAGG